MVAYKVTAVREDSIMQVEWPGNKTTRHPIPTDLNGDALDGDDLDFWAEDQYQANVSPRNKDAGNKTAMEGKKDQVRQSKKRPKPAEEPV